MTSDQEELARKIATAKHRLKEAMKKPPFDINDAGVTRIAAWKKAYTKAQQVLSRNPSQEAPYVDARIDIEACGGASVSELAKRAFG